jgi:uncharacterized membrane protein YidH (DUF202 family)
VNLARERTLDGAYWRTSIGLIGASLALIRLFKHKFLNLSIVFICLGIVLLIVDYFRRRAVNPNPKNPNPDVFMTSGTFVLITTIATLTGYCVVLFLVIYDTKY